MDGAGNVYIADTGNNAIKKWVAANHTVTNLVASGMYWAYGVAVDGAGNVYIADTGNNAIKKWDATSHTVSTLGGYRFEVILVAWPWTVRGAQSISPTRVTIKFKIGFGFPMPASRWLTGLSNPEGVAVDRNGNVYIADSGNKAIKELPQAFVDTTARWKRRWRAAMRCRWCCRRRKI